MLQNIVNSFRSMSGYGAGRRRIESDDDGTISGDDSGVYAIEECSHAQAVLDRYKERSNTVREDYLRQLTNQTLSFLSGKEERRLRQEAADDLICRSMISVIDSVYATVEPYIFELNRAVINSELVVSATAPAMVTEHLLYDSLRQPVQTVTTYRARISTCRLSIVIRGFEDRIDFFILPVQQVMGLSRIEQEHAPLMTFRGSIALGEVGWMVEGKLLTDERLERYSLLTFNYLIEETREELEALAQASIA